MIRAVAVARGYTLEELEQVRAEKAAKRGGFEKRMSYSYRPVLIKAILNCADDKGRVKLEGIVRYFRSYYEGRRSLGQKVENANSIFANCGYTDKEAERNFFANPFKRFEDLNMMHYTKTLGIVQVDESVWKHLDVRKRAEIEMVCNEKLPEHYRR